MLYPNLSTEGRERPVGIYYAKEGGHQLELGDLLKLTDPSQTENWQFETPHDFLWFAGSHYAIHYACNTAFFNRNNTVKHIKHIKEHRKANCTLD